MPKPRPTIAIAGLGIESSTFSPARTNAPAFHPHRGPEVLTRYPFLAPGTPSGNQRPGRAPSWARPSPAAR